MLRTGFLVVSGDLRASYSFADKFAIIGNGQFAKGDTRWGHGRLLELGIGYYNVFNEKLVFEAYAGGGGGNVTNVYENGARSKFSMRKSFLQPQLGFRSRILLSLLVQGLHF